MEKRKYRLRLLNGCDSRFLVIEFHAIRGGARAEAMVVPDNSDAIPFVVIGSDQGLGSTPTKTNRLLIETGSRYDIIFDFDFPGIFQGDRIIMKNLGGDSPFGGDIPGEQVFSMTDRIMAFDVVKPFNPRRGDPPVKYSEFSRFGADKYTNIDRYRTVALFEGKFSCYKEISSV